MKEVLHGGEYVGGHINKSLKVKPKCLWGPLVTGWSAMFNTTERWRNVNSAYIWVGLRNSFCSIGHIMYYSHFRSFALKHSMTYHELYQVPYVAL